MEKGFLEIMWMVIKTQAGRIAFSILLLIPVIIFIVRQIQATYRAEIVLINSTNGSSPSSLASASAANFLGMNFSSLERDTFITSQQVLLKSYDIYNRVSEALKSQFPETWFKFTKNDSDASKWVPAILRILYGESYLSTTAQFRDRGYSQFLKRVSFEPNLESGTFKIQFVHENPKFALAATEAISKALIEMNVRLANDEAEKVTKFLADKVEEARSNAEKVAREITNFIKVNDFPNQPEVILERQKTFLEVQKSIEQTRMQIEGSRIMTESAENIVAKLKEDLKLRMSDGTSAHLDSLQNELRRFQAALQMAEQSSGNKEDVSIIRSKIADINEEIRSIVQQNGKTDTSILDERSLQGHYSEVINKITEYRLNLEGANARLAQAQKIEERYRKEINRYPALQERLTQLVLDQTERVKVLSALTEQYIASSIQREVKISKISVVGKPYLIDSLIMSSKTEMLSILGIATVLCIVLVFTAYHVLRRTILVSGQLVSHGQGIHSGVIPNLRNVKKDHILAGVRYNEDFLKPAHAILRALPPKKNGQGYIITFVSHFSQAGKSISSLGVGLAMARRSERTLILDCDHRAADRNLTEYVETGSPNYKVSGLMDYLSKVNLAPNSAGGINVANLSDTGNSPVERSDFLTVKFREIIPNIKQHNDITIVDSPPLFVSDSIHLIEQSDAIVLCCPEGSCTEKDIEQSFYVIEQYRSQHAVVFTLLTNSRFKVNLSRDSSYRYRYGNNKAA